jgi:uncharacterized protein (TIGR03437 family)
MQDAGVLHGVCQTRVNLPVDASAPGVFTINSFGQGNVFNQDSSENGALNPAPKGSVVTIYATGAGQTIPDGDDGRLIGSETLTPALPIAVRMGGVTGASAYVYRDSPQALGSFRDRILEGEGCNRHCPAVR